MRELSTYPQISHTHRCDQLKQVTPHKVWPIKTGHTYGFCTYGSVTALVLEILVFRDTLWIPRSDNSLLLKRKRCDRRCDQLKLVTPPKVWPVFFSFNWSHLARCDHFFSVLTGHTYGHTSFNNRLLSDLGMHRVSRKTSISKKSAVTLP